MTDEVFQEAVEALREGNKAKARELLTGLLKTDQGNATYWVWMSATVDSEKERVYCLQTAFKLDPENATAKRGLILLGSLPPDETIQPFSLNRPRVWEQKLLLAHEKPKPKGWAAIKASPVFRLGGIAVLIAALTGFVYFGFVVPARQQARPPTSTPGASPTWTFTPTALNGRLLRYTLGRTFSLHDALPISSTPGASPTWTFTPTALNATSQPQAAGTPLPFSELLEVPYTPTALYVNTPRSPLTMDMYSRFDNAFKSGNWDEAIAAMQEIARLEPEYADPYYYIGEAYRFKGDMASAIDAYNLALQANVEFGPAYVGLARARIHIDPGANTEPLLDEAIRFDPNFGEAYLERAKVRLRDNNIAGAIVDLDNANRLLPNSPLVYYTLAVARQREGEFDLALTTALHASQLDVTYMPTYLLLGQLYEATGTSSDAVRVLDIYLKYNEGDADAYMLLGRMQFADGDYEETIRTMNRVIGIDRNRREAYLYRFYANIELGNGEAADEDLDRLLVYYPDLFDFNIALTRAHLIQKRNGSALQIIEKAISLAESDEQRATAYFWAGAVYEERDELDKAAEYWQLLLFLNDYATTE